jgi:gamma-glutamylputrescine oxidase
MREASYYAASLRCETEYPALEGEAEADVAVVGGGFTGVAAALGLAERGRRVVLVEAKKIGWGASGRNGGQVTGSLSGDAAMTRQLRRAIGAEAENFVWKLRWRGHAIIEDRVRRYAIACDLKHGHMQTALKAAHLDELRASAEETERRGMGSDIRLVPRGEIGDWIGSALYVGGLYNARNMHLHPLDLVIGEARAAESLGARL